MLCNWKWKTDYGLKWKLKWNAEPISEMRQTNIQQIIWQHFKQAYANIGFRHENKWK